jgi:hypothetical protein
MVVADRNIEPREIKSAACRLSMIFPLMLAFHPEVYPHEGFVTQIQDIDDRAATMIRGLS